MACAHSAVAVLTVLTFAQLSILTFRFRKIDLQLMTKTCFPVALRCVTMLLPKNVS